MLKFVDTLKPLFFICVKVIKQHIMRNKIYTTVLIATMFAAFNTQAIQAQKDSRRASTTSVRTTSKSAVRIPSTKVVYKKPKKLVTSYRVLPSKTIINHKGLNYYYSNRNYYTYSGGRYIVIQPKIGFRINTLPVGYVNVRFNNKHYFWSNGVFYTQVNNEYEVIEPEIGTVIYELPADYERVTIDGNTYYEFSNVLYEKIQIDGSRAYEVVGFID